MAKRTFTTDELEIIQESKLRLVFASGADGDGVNIYDESRDEDDTCIGHVALEFMMIFICAYISGREHGRQLAFGEVLDQEAERREHFQEVLPCPECGEMGETYFIHEHNKCWKCYIA